MAQYKVPQDVEADDKLLGPFSFRQFVYLLIAAGLIALAVGLFQLFPVLAIIPLPPVLLLLVLALPLKKDQPMETYLAAMVSYYLKPHTRLWTPGQRDTTILITAPKIVEEVRTRDITGEEATHRLSFLADIVDTEGYAIKNTANSSMRDDLVAEANEAVDMFDEYQTANIDRAISENKTMQQTDAKNSMQAELEKLEAARKEEERKRREELKRKQDEEHRQAIESMRGAIARGDEVDMKGATIQNDRGMIKKNESEEEEESPKNVDAKSSKSSIMESASNSDASADAQEDNRIKGKDGNEIFVSLH
jgi:hypothetical protein